jgi:DNA-binding winged helix-turn-helix (wHTH) protein
LLRYHFDDFVLSPRRRVLLRAGVEQPLIPRYFDLLVFLVERRHEAVHRRDIFDRVWADVNVSDSALSQAIRSIRVALGDDSKEPRYIRTVSRHGYRFVCPDVREEVEDDAGAPAVAPAVTPAANFLPPGDPPMWAAGALGGGISGALAGAAGGVMLVLAPGSSASFALVPVLALVGAACGAAGGAGVGGGMSIAESVLGMQRVIALLVGGAFGGGATGLAAEWLGRWTLAALMGIHINIGGALEGVVIGAAAGVGYGVATKLFSTDRRWLIAAVTAACCAAAGLALALAGRPLVGGTIHAIASGVTGSQAALTPLGRLIGEPDFGPISRAIIGAGEAMVFGLGVALGLSRRSHDVLTER